MWRFIKKTGKLGADVLFKGEISNTVVKLTTVFCNLLFDKTPHICNDILQYRVKALLDILYY